MTESRRKIWIALFSQSGSELKALCEKLGRYPDAILTNNTTVDWHNDSIFQDQNILVDTPKQIFATLRDYNVIFVERLKADIIITLHGFLRILPEDICEMFEIYNGHPGDIVTYPELKGKDPQAKALELGHTTARAVIHKVTPVVDDGEIVAMTPYIMIDGLSLDQVINDLKTLSVIEWCHLMKEKLN